MSTLEMVDHTKKERKANVLIRHLNLVILLLLIVIPSLTNPNFRTIQNLEGFLQSSGILILLAMGEALVLLVAGVDLSVGATIALGSVLLSLSIAGGMNTILAVALTLVAATATGILNGVIVSYLKIPSFITTFGMMGLEVSIALVISGGNRISLPTSSALPALASSSVVGVPYQIWLVIFVVVVGTFFLRHYAIGRHLYAVGSNPSAARLSGVSVPRTLLLAFAGSGLLAGLAATVYTARIVSGDPIAAGNLNLQAIAAAVIGGVSLFGGRGTLVGACIGAIIYQIITNVLNLYGIDPNITEVSGGLIILLAAYANVTGLRDNRT
jgi:ribose transport system permease protein